MQFLFLFGRLIIVIFTKIKIIYVNKALKFFIKKMKISYIFKFKQH